MEKPKRAEKRNEKESKWEKLKSIAKDLTAELGMSNEKVEKRRGEDRRRSEDKRRSEEKGKRNEEKHIGKGMMSTGSRSRSGSRIKHEEEAYSEEDSGGDIKTSKGLRSALDDLKAFELDNEEDGGGSDTEVLLRSARDALEAFRSEDNRGDEYAYVWDNEEFAAVEDRGRIREKVKEWEADILEREREWSQHRKTSRPRAFGDDFSNGGIDTLDDLIPDSARRMMEIDRYTKQSEDIDRGETNPADAYVLSLDNHEEEKWEESTDGNEREAQVSRHHIERKRAREISKEQENREGLRIFRERQISEQRRIFLETATSKELDEINKKDRKWDDERKRELEKVSWVKRETKVVFREDVHPDLHKELGFTRWKRKIEVELVPGGGMSKKKKESKDKDEELVEISRSGKVRSIAKVVDPKGRNHR